MHTYIIAEAGVNHNGSLENAYKLIDAAAKAGADCVKFQSFNAAGMISKSAPKALYQKINTGNDESQLAMVQKLQLSFGDQIKLRDYAVTKKIDFLSSPFDIENLRFLAKDLGLKTVKIPSGEVTNTPLLFEAGKLGVDLILSSGMCLIGDLELALGAYACGLIGKVARPTVEDFVEAYSLHFDVFCKKVKLLHCVTDYPAASHDINLNVLDSLRAAFNLPVGYSDHTLGIYITLAAVAKGACVIEKHFTLDKNMPGPDHKASLEPHELLALVEGVRIIEQASGHSRKVNTDKEFLNRKIVRKSIVAKRQIEPGEKISEENITVKRCFELGLSPSLVWQLYDKTVVNRIEEDSLVQFSHLK